MAATWQLRAYQWGGFLIAIYVGWTGGCFPRVTRETKLESYSGNKLILILLDGFRWDYLNRSGLTGFGRIRREGVHAEYMEPVFPSLSYPNYYSIVTGRYVESHGVTLNYMWDPETNESLSAASHWWEGAEPLWITAAKGGLRTDMYLWPGCNAVIFNTTPASCVPYETRIWVDDFERELYEVTEKMEAGLSDVGLIYCEQPDLFGHIFGPESFLMDNVLHKLDSIFDVYLKSLDNRGLRDKINVIIVSDHGMTPVDFWAADKIPITDYINPDNVDKILDRGAIVGIFPAKGKTNEVVKQLKEMKGTQVWRKEDLPKRFHYNGPNTPPVVLLAYPKFFIKAYPDKEKSTLSFGYVPPLLADSLVSGFHGYDPEGFPDMRGIFLAFGPDLKVGLQAPPIKNIDVYNLAITLIGQKAIANNGTWNSVKDFLRCPPKTCKVA